MEKKYAAMRKLATGKPGKSRQNQPAGAFMALGVSRPETPESKTPKRPLEPSGESSGSGPGPNPAKVSRSDSSTSSVQSIKKDIIDETSWQALATINVLPSNLLTKVTNAEEKLKTTRVPKILCSVVKALQQRRLNDPDPGYASGLGYLAKAKPAYFQETPVIEAFCTLLRKPNAAGKLSKPTYRAQHLAANTLATAFEDVQEWPLLFLKIYMEDSLGDRLWVDAEECVPFTRGIETAFGTVQSPPELTALLGYGGSLSFSGGGGEVLPPGDMGIARMMSSPGRSTSPAPTPTNTTSTTLTTESKSTTTQGQLNTSAGSSGDGGTEITGLLTLSDTAAEDSSAMDLLSALEEGEDMETSTLLSKITKKMRYSSSNREVAQLYALGQLREWWARRLDTNAPRSLLRTMACMAGMQDVRSVTIQRLDPWLQNPKLQKAALQLLMAICTNCPEPTTAQDYDFLALITKLRNVKGKPMSTVYSACIRDIYGRTKAGLSTMVKLVAMNEVSSPSSRGSNNMMIIQQAFVFDSSQAAQLLADICCEIISTTTTMPGHDYLNTARAFLRELVRNVLRCDFPMVQFAQRLMLCASTKMPESTNKEKFLDNVIDLVCLPVILCHSTAMRDAIATKRNLEPSGIAEYLEEIKRTKQVAIDWLYAHAVPVMKPSTEAFVHAIMRVLFVEKPEWYSKDGWPSDNERNTILRTIGESGIHEDTLSRVLEMGLSGGVASPAGVGVINHPINPQAALDIVDSVVRKAAGATLLERNSTEVTNPELINLLLHSCSYRPPETIPLPVGYKAPMVAISSLYWKTWIILSILSTRNPKTLGECCWKNYPTMRLLLEMTMIGEFNWPPTSISTDEVQAYEARDLQERDRERHAVLEMETHLAQSTITEQSSHLLSLLMSLEPKGPARRPPPGVIEQLEALNRALNIGLDLCKSRDPDFLLDIVSRQGGNMSSQPWLLRLMESNQQGSLSVLPVECLCEFLMHQLKKDATTKTRASSSGKFGIGMESAQSPISPQTALDIGKRLRLIIWDPSSTFDTVSKSILYFVNRLGGPTTNDRDMAAEALDRLLTKSDPSNEPMDTDAADKKNKNLIQATRWLEAGLIDLTQHAEQLAVLFIKPIRRAMLLETDPDRVLAYLHFVLTSNQTQKKQKTEPGQEEDQQDLLMDLSHVIVQRRALMKKLFPTNNSTATAGASDGWSERAKEVFNSLLSTFSEYVSTVVLDSTKEVVWSESQDILQIEWGEQEKAVLPLKIINGAISLLGVSVSDSESYEQLLAYWLPDAVKGCKRPAPIGRLLDTSEETDIWTDELRLRLLAAGDPRLSKTILSKTKCSATQLVRYLSEFGLPTSTVTVILKELDTASSNKSNKEKLKKELNADVNFGGADKMAAKNAHSFLKAQIHRKGVTGGKTFLKFMNDYCRSDGIPSMEEMPKGTKLRIKPYVDNEEEIEEIPEKKSKEDDEMGWEEQMADEALKDPWLKSNLSSMLGSMVASNPGGGVQNVRNVVPECLRQFIPGSSKVSSRRESMEEGQISAGPVTPSSSVGNLSSIGKAELSMDELIQRSTLPKRRLRINKILGKLEKSIAASAESATGSKNGNLKSSSPNIGKGSILEHNAMLEEWMQIDPDIVVVVRERSLELIFHRTSFPAQASLANKLIHRPSIPIILNVLQSLLSSCNPKLSGKCVLNFVEAVRNVPGLQYQEDRCTPRNRGMDDILQLTNEQIVVLFEYMQDEVEQENDQLKDKHQNLKIMMTSQFSVVEKVVINRLPLIKGVLAEDDEKMEAAVRYLIQQFRSSGAGVGDSVLLANGPSDVDNKNSIWRLIILHLYFQYPSVIQDFMKSGGVSMDSRRALCNRIEPSVHFNHTQMDAMLHGLISDLFAKAGKEKALADSIHRTLALIKAIGKIHPTMIVRQFPMIAASLRGKTSQHMRLLSTTNWMIVIHGVLSLLESVEKTVILQRTSRQGVLAVLSCYFELIKAHCLRSRNLAMYVERTFKFLESLYTADADSVSQFVDEHSLVVQACAMRYPNMGRSLRNVLALPFAPMVETEKDKNETSEELAEIATKGGLQTTGIVPSFQRPRSPVTYADTTSMQQRLRQAIAGNNAEDILTLLRAIDDHSEDQKQVLRYLVSDLHLLMTHPQTNIRESVFELIMRHLSDNPQEATQIVQLYQACLANSNTGVAQTAYKYLDEFVILCRDNSYELMDTAFSSLAESSLVTDECSTGFISAIKSSSY